ncbi:GTPase Era [Candidatus Contubernalis alkaliaceticus]|uniref:GTPase Era n=1 Tax=Candidatus Contubernalis alkaliaceticus TaxID=338645 RepID=UPI001F4C2FBA|nr:GTPase Era [Candidatus Contubernalis alkalaceticus]UNC92996.1 GTPase Era [Candidatus Contubernalis alkalaceticus]
MFKSGVVAVVGRPNVGKSTLLNYLMKQKLTIISDKPQTTRNKITCILTTQEAQIIFLDTPGLHKPRTKLGEYMVKVSVGSLREVDIVLFLVEASHPPGRGDGYVVDLLKQAETRVFLVINKIDLVEPLELEGIIERYRELYDFSEVILVSAVNGTNVTLLQEKLVAHLPEGPKYYPEDMITEQPERFVVSELIREKILEQTRDEVPHSVAVEVDEMKERKGKNMIYIRANIFVERDSQKGIIVGNQGKMLKEIGMKARQDIQVLLGCKVFLELWVKVQKDWRNRSKFLKDFGYHDRE